MYGYRSKQDEAFDLLVDRGIKTAIVHFSGGNDEGGADGIKLVKHDGTEIDLNSRAQPKWDDSWENVIGWTIWEYKPGGSTERDATPEEAADAELAALLEEPVNAQYGGFGGEGRVNGEFTWDVAARKVTVHENYQAWSDRDYDL